MAGRTRESKLQHVTMLLFHHLRKKAEKQQHASSQHSEGTGPGSQQGHVGSMGNRDAGRALGLSMTPRQDAETQRRAGKELWPSSAPHSWLGDLPTGYFHLGTLVSFF